MKTPTAVQILELRSQSGLTQKKCEALLGLECGAFQSNIDKSISGYRKGFFNLWENDQITMSPYIWHAFQMLVKDNQ